MIVFACDTALDACSAALVRDQTVLGRISETMRRGQAERLPLMARELMQNAGAAYGAIDRITVTVGPGSFTGVRVGLSFARALALSLQRPCVGVSTLEALALEDGEGGLRAALIETPGASYCALYEDGRPLLAPRASERGEHEALFAATAPGRAIKLKGPGAAPEIAVLARRAAGLDPALYRPDPLYLRASGATLPA